MGDLSQWTARQVPGPVALTGRYAMIEPFRRALHEKPLWDALGGKRTNELLRYFPSGPFRTSGDMADWLDAANVSSWVTHVIRTRRSGEVVGMASYMRADPGNGVVEIGSVAHGAAMARMPIATDAHYLLARHVFEDLGYRRYEWKCHNLNEASKIAALRLGFTFEGVFRQHMISKGENRDTAWFSMIDSEWPRLSAALVGWLTPGNFDAEGRQIRRLETIREELP